MALSAREQRLLRITIFIGVIGVLFIGWKLISSNLSSSDVSVATQDQFKEILADIENVEEQKQRNLLLKNKLGNENAQFIKANEILKFVAELEKVAGQSGMQIKSYSYNENKRTKPVPRLDVRLTIQGQFEKLITFLDNLRQAEILCQPSRLRCSLMDKNRPDLDIQITVSTFLIDASSQTRSPSIIARG